MITETATNDVTCCVNFLQNFQCPIIQDSTHVYGYIEDIYTAY